MDRIAVVLVLLCIDTGTPLPLIREGAVYTLLGRASDGSRADCLRTGG
jgi:hypothetical protein